MGGSVAEVLREIAEESCRLEGAELWELRLIGGRRRSILRITVDHPQGVPFDLLERVSRRMSKVLDERDPISGPYVLECESPGLDRRLRNLDDCRRFLGEAVRLRRAPPADGQKNFRGRIADVSQDALLLEEDPGRAGWIPWPEVEDVHLDPKV